MSCYVDRLQEWGWKMYGRTVASCHLIADTEAELHAMAEAIGLKRRHVQRSALGNVHYDLTPTRRARAVELGTIELGRVDFVNKTRELRGEPRRLHVPSGSETPGTR